MASKKMKKKCKNAYLDQSYLKDKKGKCKGLTFYNKATRLKDKQDLRNFEEE